MLEFERERRTNPVVLIVDDDPAQLLMLSATLHQADMLVIEACNGAQALDIFTRQSPDLVLMDIKMPVMDGLVACVQMRRSSSGRDIPIVLITGLDDHKSINQAFDADATDFITKPVNWPTLIHRVRYLLKASQAFIALRQSETHLSYAQQIGRLRNWKWDIVGDVQTWGAQVCNIFALDAPSGTECFEDFLGYVHPEDRDTVRQAVEHALKNRINCNIDHRIILPDGSERTVYEQAELILSPYGDPLFIQGTVQDITSRKMAEEKIRNLAYFDTLTGLPNRTHFKEYANGAIDLARREGNNVALLYLDLDNFKRINETLGHDVGDELLKSISQNLTSGLRSSDRVFKGKNLTTSTTTLSRLGSDQFTILLCGLSNEEQVATVAQRVLDHLSHPIVLHGQELFITAGIGIAVYPNDAGELDTLLKHADIAMHQAKNQGRNNFQFYSAQLNVHTPNELVMEARLRRGLENKEFVLHYQPQIAASSGKITGMEALVRWNDPDSDLIPPNDFIPVAESSGLILSLGDWILLSACQQAMAWQRAGIPPMRISVNISGLQFRQHDFIEKVEQSLQISGLPPQYLELEMTESIIMQQVERNITNLNRLKQLGIHLAIDDFGTGYSSMNYLKRFPLDTLKIDQSFVNDIAINCSDAAIVKAIIALAQSLDLATTAEGVETQAQLTFLQDQCCDNIQGYFFSKPLPAADFEQFVLLHNRQREQKMKVVSVNNG